MTVEEAQAYFNSLGYQPIFKTEQIDIPTDVPITRTDTWTVERNDGRAAPGPGGEYDLGPGETVGESTSVISKTYQVGATRQNTKMTAIAMSADGKTPIIEGVVKTGSGEISNSFPSSTGGGGTSKPAKKPAKSAKIKRYKDIDTSLQHLTDAYEKAKKQDTKRKCVKKQLQKCQRLDMQDGMQHFLIKGQ